MASNVSSLGNGYPLRIGRSTNPGATASVEMDVVDLRIYDVPFTDADISNTFCSTVVESTDAFYSNLIGYWKFSQLSTSAVPNLRQPNDPTESFVMQEATVRNVDALIPAFCVPITKTYYSAVPTSVDASIMIATWLGFPNAEIRNWDGKNWGLAFPFQSNN